MAVFVHSVVIVCRQVRLNRDLGLNEIVSDDILKEEVKHNFKINKKLQGASLVAVRWVGEIRWSSLLSYLAIMYQSKSISSLTIPPGKALGNFLKGQIPHPPGHKNSAKSRPLGQKDRAKSPPRGNYFQKSSKNKIMRQKL